MGKTPESQGEGWPQRKTDRQKPGRSVGQERLDEALGKMRDETFY